MDCIYQNNVCYQLVGSLNCEFFVSDGRLNIKISDYYYLKNMPKEAWAWEFTRRNPKYINAWATHLKHCQKQSFLAENESFKKNEMVKASEFGLLYFIDPDLNSKSVDVFWSPEIMPYVLNCSLIDRESEECNSSSILADLFLELSYVETFDGNSHLIVKDKCCSIQLLFDEKLDLNTVFDFEIHIPSYCDFPEQLQSASCLCQFLTEQKCKKLHSLSASKINQYIEILFAYDLIKVGYSHRAAAEIMFGEEALIDGWDSVSEYIRTRMRRLISRGKNLVNAGSSTFMKSKK